MNGNSGKFNWQVQAAALCIFFLGLLGGALGLNAYQVWFGGAAHSDRKPRQRFEQIFEQLELDEAQKADVQKIVGETRGEMQELRSADEEKIRQIRARADERLKQIFKPEQYEKFTRLRDQLREGEKQRR